MTHAQPPGRSSTIALAIAVLWSLVVLVAGFFAPVYQSLSSSPSGEPVRGTGTVVGVNGLDALPELAVPLLASVVVGWAVLQRPHRWAMPVAWAVTALLGGLTMLAMLTIGIFVLPVVFALVVACAYAAPAHKPA